MTAELEWVSYIGVAVDHERGRVRAASSARESVKGNERSISTVASGEAASVMPMPHS